MSTTPKTEEITAAEWLDIRDAVAVKVKAGTTSQFSTCVNIAERLLRAGFVDIDSVRRSIAPVRIVESGEEA